MKPNLFIAILLTLLAAASAKAADFKEARAAYLSLLKSDMRTERPLQLVYGWPTGESDKLIDLFSGLSLTPEEIRELAINGIDLIKTSSYSEAEKTEAMLLSFAILDKLILDPVSPVWNSLRREDLAQLPLNLDQGARHWKLENTFRRFQKFCAQDESPKLCQSILIYSLEELLIIGAPKVSQPVFKSLIETGAPVWRKLFKRLVTSGSDFGGDFSVEQLAGSLAQIAAPNAFPPNQSGVLDPMIKEELLQFLRLKTPDELVQNKFGSTGEGYLGFFHLAGITARIQERTSDQDWDKNFVHQVTELVKPLEGRYRFHRAQTLKKTFLARESQGVDKSSTSLLMKSIMDSQDIYPFSEREIQDLKPALKAAFLHHWKKEYIGYSLQSNKGFRSLFSKLINDPDPQFAVLSFSYLRSVTEWHYYRDPKNSSAGFALNYFGFIEGMAKEDFFRVLSKPSPATLRELVQVYELVYNRKTSEAKVFTDLRNHFDRGEFIRKDVPGRDQLQFLAQELSNSTFGALTLLGSDRDRMKTFAKTFNRYDFIKLLNIMEEGKLRHALVYNLWSQAFPYKEVVETQGFSEPSVQFAREVLAVVAPSLSEAEYAEASRRVDALLHDRQN